MKKRVSQSTSMSLYMHMGDTTKMPTVAAADNQLYQNSSFREWFKPNLLPQDKRAAYTSYGAKK